MSDRMAVSVNFLPLIVLGWTVPYEFLKQHRVHWFFIQHRVFLLQYKIVMVFCITRVRSNVRWEIHDKLTLEEKEQIPSLIANDLDDTQLLFNCDLLRKCNRLPECWSDWGVDARPTGHKSPIFNHWSQQVGGRELKRETIAKNDFKKLSEPKPLVWAFREYLTNLNHFSIKGQRNFG